MLYAVSRSAPANTITLTYSSGEGRALPSASFQTLRIPAAAAAAAASPSPSPSPDDTLERLLSEERSSERRRPHQSSADQGRFLTALAVRVSSYSGSRSKFSRARAARGGWVTHSRRGVVCCSWPYTLYSGQLSEGDGGKGGKVTKKTAFSKLGS